MEPSRDLAPCAECLGELSDPGDRRHRDPFVSCAHCGPRLTLVEDVLGGRAATTMAGFPMCATCAQEHGDPAGRRHLDDAISCPGCGPTLSLLAPDGACVATGTEPALAAAVRALQEGSVLAVKGVGGYHLACDAADADAVRRLRERARRPHQPLAVVARDLATAERLVEVGSARGALLGRDRPFVLLPVRGMARVAPDVAPGLGELGVALPSEPLQHLLFADLPDGSPGAPPVLAVTSADLSGDPVCVDDVEALLRLGPVADLLLVHDRPIATPCGDSVLSWGPEGAVPLRVARGRAPLSLRFHDGPVVLAAGADRGNTLALAHAGRVHVSAHVGDLVDHAAREHHRLTAERLVASHGVRPEVVATDRRPGGASHTWATSYAGSLDVPLVEVQHHHAHLAALAAEHGRLDQPLLGLVLDGGGHGDDGTVWGGELLLLCDRGATSERLGRLGTVLLPGGEEAVRHPVRTAALALLDAGRPLDGTAVGDELTEPERTFVERAHASGAGGVVTSSAGRLFDVVASVLGVRHRVTYEAQAAHELEALATRWRRTHGDTAHRQAHGLPLPLGRRDGLHVVEPAPLVLTLDRARRHGADPGALAHAFHRALGRALADLAARAASPRGLTAVGLTGGVFANRLLVATTTACLRDHGLQALTHRTVPPGDGGLALGQAAVAAARTLTYES